MSDIKIVDAETTKLETKYCIPEWLREEQIKMACSRFKNRIHPYTGNRTNPIAVVCFGPSLNQTWEEIRGFKYIISCSGAHKFLMDRDIIPTWHMEVDPRAHKIQLIGDRISNDTDFLMASCVHPLVFDHLEKLGARITLWHTYSGESTSVMPLVYPRGEWVSTGGANVGLRAFVIARILGFTNLHVFGMDGSFPESGELKHAAFHPNICKGHMLAEYGNKKYATTTAFLECARGTFHELEMLPDTEVTFYGDGLIQDMAKIKIPELKKKQKSRIAFFVSPTISQDYIQQNRQLHQSNPVYGTSVIRHLDTIKKLYEVTDSKSLLDYGCGKGLLARNLDFPIWEYDPAIVGKDSPARQADLVVCVDVLEHIEPEFLDSVLVDIARCSKKIAYLVIGTYAAIKTLPDGRNTHLIQQGAEWWRAKLGEYFVVPVDGIKERNGELHIIVSSRNDTKFVKESFVLLGKEEHVHCTAA